MAGKKRSPPLEDTVAKKKCKHQSTLGGKVQRPGSAPPDVEMADNDAPFLDAACTQDLEIARDKYLADWGVKCMTKSRAEADSDLDATGLRAVAEFCHAVRIADARGAALAPDALELLALITRNDCVHHRTRVSSAAHAALAAHLAAHPFARLARHEEGSGTYAGCPYVVISPRSAWLPLQPGGSFSSKYLLASDMACSGMKYDQETSGAAPPPSATARSKQGAKRLEPCELLLDFVAKGLKSAEEDCNGDLLMLQYILTVLEQDLAVRLQVHAAYGAERFRCDPCVADRRQALLENSLAWRMLDCSLASQGQVRETLVTSLMRLIVGPSSDWGADADAELAEAEEEPDDDAPAAACIFTARELSALASRLLNAMLKLYGAAEGAGAFYCLGRVRAGKDNLRVELDKLLLGAFWTERGVCKGPDAARALLRSLPPRDALRLLCLLAAQKLALTYPDFDSLGARATVVGDLRPLREAADVVAFSRGGDLQRFFEVDASMAVSSLRRDPARSVQAYRSVNHLAVVLGGVAAAASALLAAGEEVPCGPGGGAGLKAELEQAAAAVAKQAVEGCEGREACRLDRAGAAELVAVQMAVTTMA